MDESKLTAFELKPVNAFQFKQAMGELIARANRMIELLPDNGNNEEESQKICLRARLRSFEWAVDGMADEDLKSTLS